MVSLKQENIYVSPLIVIQGMDFEGVLCSSPGNESVGEEDGNGSFI